MPIRFAYVSAQGKDVENSFGRVEEALAFLRNPTSMGFDFRFREDMATALAGPEGVALHAALAEAAKNVNGHIETVRHSIQGLTVEVSNGRVASPKPGWSYGS